LKKLIKFIAILFIFQIFINGCINDAERDNPLDPRSTRFRHEGIIRGKIYSFYPPHRSLSDVDVFLMPAYQWAKSNKNGEFIFFNLPENEYTIYVSCENYMSDTVFVMLQAGSEEYVQVHLNGIPAILNYTLAVGHISRWWPPDDIYILRVNVEVDDPDGVADISQVHITLPDFQFSDLLQRTNDPAIFSKLIYENQMPVNSLHEVLGHPFKFQVVDYPAACLLSEAVYVARIIEDTPIPAAPQRPDTLSNSAPYLNWQRSNLPYAFSYKVEVYRIEQGINSLVWNQSDIPADSMRARITESLSTGSYYWTLALVDEFGNWSRSKEAAFYVE